MVATYPTIGSPWKARTSRNETGRFREFVEFAEEPSKTRPGGLNAKPRQFQAKMFQTGGERCPVVLFIACRTGEIFFCASAHIVKNVAAILNFSGSGRLERERKFYQGGER